MTGHSTTISPVGNTFPVSSWNPTAYKPTYVMTGHLPATRVEVVAQDFAVIANWLQMDLLKFRKDHDAENRFATVKIPAILVMPAKLAFITKARRRDGFYFMRHLPIYVREILTCGRPPEIETEYFIESPTRRVRVLPKLPLVMEEPIEVVPVPTPKKRRWFRRMWRRFVRIGCVECPRCKEQAMDFVWEFPTKDRYKCLNCGFLPLVEGKA